MSLPRERTTLPETRRETGDRVARWIGLLLVMAGLLLMSLAGAVPAAARGSWGTAGKDELHSLTEGGEVAGLGGADELYGGPRQDVLLAGEGDDFVEAADGKRDLVLRGPGDDAASVDRADLVASDCESVYPG